MPTKIETKPIIKKALSKKINYIYALGRRKTATARVRLFAKSGDMIVNEVAAGKYFPGLLAQSSYLKPFVTVDQPDKFSFSAKIEGSGKKSQLGALIHGLSRALVKFNPEFRSPLKKAGLLTRDPRMKESRQVGTGGKARRRKQSPKR